MAGSFRRIRRRPRRPARQTSQLITISLGDDAESCNCPICQALGIDVSGVPAGEAIITEVSPEEMDLVARYMVANDDFDSTDWN